jgi:serine/threonine protein kinase
VLISNCSLLFPSPSLLCDMSASRAYSAIGEEVNEPGSRTFEDTAYRIFPQPPLQENEFPRLEPCITRPKGVIVLPNDAADHSDPLVVDVMKAYDAQRAYMRVYSLESIPLDHHAPGWGLVYFAVVLHRVGENTFRYPDAEDVELVAIKRLNKAVVLDALGKGKKENPYKEIQRMQSLGDNIHVLGLTDEGALHNEDYLYCIVPYGQSLVKQIPWGQGFPEAIASALYENILENILYLHRHAICHRDLSTDNCLFVGGRLVFLDLAMSFRIPESGYVTPMGRFGKMAYLPPEVFRNAAFEATACDLWASAVILFNLLTGEILCLEPYPDDISFRYFVLAGGLSRVPENERTVEILNQECPSQSKLRRVVAKCLHLSHDVLDLLDGVLKLSAFDRWSTFDVIECAWMTRYRHQRS